MPYCFKSKTLFFILIYVINDNLNLFLEKKCLKSIIIAPQSVKKLEVTKAKKSSSWIVRFISIGMEW
jgi:ABC-type polar amino acid transport system ATPase subunit